MSLASNVHTSHRYLCVIWNIKIVIKAVQLVNVINPYPAKVENMVSSYYCQQMADGI